MAPCQPSGENLFIFCKLRVIVILRPHMPRDLGSPSPYILLCRSSIDSSFVSFCFRVRVVFLLAPVFVSCRPRLRFVSFLVAIVFCLFFCCFVSFLVSIFICRVFFFYCGCCTFTAGPERAVVHHECWAPFYFLCIIPWRVLYMLVLNGVACIGRSLNVLFFFFRFRYRFRFSFIFV